MKQVLLTVQQINQTGSLMDGEMVAILHKYAPYAILLVGPPITWRTRKHKAHDLENNPIVEIHDREQPCIIYLTKDDLDNQNGIYQEFIPEEAEEYLYLYTAKMI